MKTSSNMYDVQCFLGMLGYYRRFVPDFATLTEPLTYLLRGKVPFVWEEEKETAFKILKNALSFKPLLVYLNFECKFIIQTDASLTSLGSVLSQISDDGNKHPVAYYSRVLNKNETNYSVTK